MGDSLNNLKKMSCLTCKNCDDSPILPGLPNDVAKHCLALVPRFNFPRMGCVCKGWRSFIKSKEFIAVRRLAGVLDEWLYVLTTDSQWEVLNCLGHKQFLVPPLPGPAETGFGVVVQSGKLLIIGGYSMIDQTGTAFADVYQYHSCLNSWSKLANMNIARYEFACAEVNGLVYAVGGHGTNGESLSSAEVYNPDTNQWTWIQSLKRPRWGSFGCGIQEKLYIMGGRSSFTIGNSKFVDVYDPEKHKWCEMKNGCVMVTSHAVLGNKLFCMEWKNQRRLSVFNSDDNSWKMVSIPVNGSSSVGFRLGVFKGKLLLFSLEDANQTTLLYDPNEKRGSDWLT